MLRKIISDTACTAWLFAATKENVYWTNNKFTSRRTITPTAIMAIFLVIVIFGVAETSDAKGIK